MRHLTLKNLSLGLEDLLTKRVAPLQSFAAGNVSVPFLSTRRDRIAALPAELTGLPQAEALALTDRRHDGFGGAIYYFTEAYLRLPDATPALIEAATKIRAAFIPSLDLLQARYDAEAQAALLNAPLVESLKAELMMFPVAPSGTLYDLALAFVNEGKELGTLLSQRADAKDRKLAVQLRGETLAKLNRLREDLADARKDDPTLPADLEAQVFGYLDLLEDKDAVAAAELKKKEAEKAAAKKKEPEKAKPAPVPAPAPVADGTPAPAPAPAPEGGTGG